MSNHHHFTDAELAEPEAGAADFARAVLAIGAGSVGLAVFFATFVFGLPLGALFIGGQL
ncbi:hypothetical protein NKI15_06710 [Mesorhizobium sp. M0862]|uniref:hypothetical protein n=1 Tax=Mesorhizobium sp. M0862 TaxID=2957015 RepID=UPI003335AD15